MRSLATLIIAPIVALFVFNTAVGSNYTAKAYKSSMNFHKIEASNLVHVVVESRTEGNIVAKIHNDFVPYFSIKVADGKLSVSINKERLKRNQRNDDSQIAVVYIPNNGNIDNISAHNLSKVTLMCDILTNECEIDASGMSQITLKNITSKQCEIDLSGASILTAEHIKSYAVECEVGGASNIAFSGTLYQAEFDITGASKIDLHESIVKTVSAEISGASVFKSDNALFEDAKIDISGASNLHLQSKICRASVSGASNARFNCSEQLTIDVSGVSHVKYSGDCKLDVISNSGMSTIKKL